MSDHPGKFRLPFGSQPGTIRALRMMQNDMNVLAGIARYAKPRAERVADDETSHTARADKRPTATP